MTQRRTREEWLALSLAYERTSQSGPVFCARHGLTLATFRWWRSQLRRDGVPALATEPVRMLSVDVTGAQRPVEAPVVVSLAGLEVRVQLGADVEYVAELVAKLRSRC
jgi:ABC-type Fe2+-enterobactin transport system substrate-binding protein